jgi:hypothetical protein
MRLVWRLESGHLHLFKFVKVDDDVSGVVVSTATHLDEGHVRALHDVLEHVLDAGISLDPFHIDARNMNIYVCFYYKVKTTH